MHQQVDAAPAVKTAAGFEHQLSAVHAELDQQRCFRIQQLDELALDAAEAVGTGDEPRLQVTRALRIAAEAALDEIDAALHRLRDGSYGICERCEQPIPQGRLEVLPTARLCTRCQYITEAGRTRSVRQARRLAGRGTRWQVMGMITNCVIVGLDDSAASRAAHRWAACIRARHRRRPVRRPRAGLADRAQRLGGEVRDAAVGAEAGCG